MDGGAGGDHVAAWDLGQEFVDEDGGDPRVLAGDGFRDQVEDAVSLSEIREAIPGRSVPGELANAEHVPDEPPSLIGRAGHVVND